MLARPGDAHFHPTGARITLSHGQGDSRAMVWGGEIEVHSYRQKRQKCKAFSIRHTALICTPPGLKVHLWADRRLQLLVKRAEMALMLIGTRLHIHRAHRSLGYLHRAPWSCKVVSCRISKHAVIRSHCELPAEYTCRHR